MLVTYLGHQGWSFETSEGIVFLDPVFRSIGNAGVQLPIWPDREVDVEKLPPIAGLLLSHEHSDHFDIDTLRRMPWRGTVWISDRSSRAMHDLLTDLNYEVRRIGPYDSVRLGDVTFHALPLQWSLIEPDAYGYLVAADDGTSFFTSVDGMPHEQTVRWLEEHHPQRSVDNFTNNYLEPLPELSGVVGNDLFATGAMAASMISGVQVLRPSRVVMSGQGWSYPPKYSELNHRFFNVTHAEMLPILEKLYPHVRWEAPEPGTVIGLRGEDCDGQRVPWVKARTTTDRDYRGYTDALEGKPWSGVHQLPEIRLARVLDFVETRWGRLIDAYGHRLVERLYRLSLDPHRTLVPTIGLRLLNGSDAMHFVMDQGWLQFRQAPEALDLRRDVAAGIEVWASDLELLIDGREEAYLVYETAVRRWCNARHLVGSTVHVHAFLPFGPRNQSEEYLAGYRARLAALEGQHCSAQVGVGFGGEPR